MKHVGSVGLSRCHHAPAPVLGETLQVASYDTTLLFDGSGSVVHMVVKEADGHAVIARVGVLFASRTRLTADNRTALSLMSVSVSVVGVVVGEAAGLVARAAVISMTWATHLAANIAAR